MLSLPLSLEKESATQIDDKTLANNLGDAVSIALHRLALAESALFHAVTVNFLESFASFKNVNYIILLLSITFQFNSIIFCCCIS
jgi:hypothetical protein